MLRLRRFATCYPRGLVARSDYIKEYLQIHDDNANQLDYFMNKLTLEKQAHLAIYLNPASVWDMPQAERAAGLMLPFDRFVEYLKVYRRSNSEQVTTRGALNARKTLPEDRILSRYRQLVSAPS